MPDWNPALINPSINRKDSASIGWILTSGARFSTNLSFLGAGITPDPGNVSALRQALGNGSNAAVVRMTETTETFTADKNAGVYDESYGDGIICLWTFENNNGEEVSFEQPNPDLSMFADDGVTIVETQAEAAAIISAAQTLINNSFDPANSYVFTRGIVRERKIGVPKGNKKRPAVAEPGAGDLPADDPAV